VKTLIALLVAVSVYTAKPKTITEPTVRKENPPFYTVENPKLFEVVLTWDCGEGYDPILTPISPRVTQTYELRGSDNSVPYCLLKSWKKAER
jgi:hypothetical protein